MKTDLLTSSFMALRDKLHRSALSILKDSEDANDALHDVFCKLWTSGQIQSDSEAKNKLFHALRNVCIDRLRRQQPANLDENICSTLSTAPDFSQDIQQLETTITAGLTELQRKIYDMIVHDGIDYDIIALRLGMTVAAVRMNMSRARKIIRSNYNNLNK